MTSDQKAGEERIGMFRSKSSYSGWMTFMNEEHERNTRASEDPGHEVVDFIPISSIVAEIRLAAQGPTIGHAREVLGRLEQSLTLTRPTPSSSNYRATNEREAEHG